MVTLSRRTPEVVTPQTNGRIVGDQNQTTYLARPQQRRTPRGATATFAVSRPRDKLSAFSRLSMSLRRRRRKAKPENKNFLSVTQCHANILNLPQAQTGKSKAFWTAVVALSVTGLTYTLLHVMHRYIKSPKASEITVESMTSLEFPAVVVCSLNPLNRTYLSRSSVDQNLARYIQSVYITMKNDASSLQLINGTNSSRYDMAIRQLVEKYPDQDLRYFFFEAGYRCDTFLEACAFEWKAFNCCDKAEPIFDTQFGKCFLFRRGLFTQHYPSAGFQLKLKIDRKVLSPQFGPQARGIALRLQPEYDASATESILMGMGVHAAVQIEELHQVYLNTPLKAKICNNRNEQGSKWAPLTTANYTQNQCIGVCFNAVALQICQCTYPQDRSMFNRVGPTRICTPLEAVNCLQQKVENDKRVHSCAQSCLPECHQTIYRTSVSTAGLESVPIDDSDTIAVDDRLIIDIFFAKIQRTNVREIYIVTADGLISQIGGLLGIFLGASMITAVQLILHWLKLCAHCLQSLNERRKGLSMPLRRSKSRRQTASTDFANIGNAENTEQMLRGSTLCNGTTDSDVDRQNNSIGFSLFESEDLT